MLHHYKVITANHTLVPIANLGQYMISDDTTLEQKLHQLKESYEIKEIMYLSTCNRVVYLLYTDRDVDLTYLQRFLGAINPQLADQEAWLSNIAVYEGSEAIQHIMEIAGSVDSMVVGEREIFRQFREAYQRGLSARLTGDNMRLLEKRIVETSKSIYTNTRIGEKPLSIAALAMSFIKDFAEQTVISGLTFIGAGETNTLMAKLLKNIPISHYHVINRGIPNGKKLADKVNGTFATFENYHSVPNNQTQVFVVCTGATSVTLTQDMFDHMATKDSPRMIIDLSVPSNTASSLINDAKIKYVDIDQLKQLAQANLHARQREISLAKQIIDEAVLSFKRNYEERKIELALREVPEEIASIKKKALEKVFNKQLSVLDEATLQLIHQMMDYMEKKCISIPIKAAKKKLL